jgi:hypothetical protein
MIRNPEYTNRPGKHAYNIEVKLAETGKIATFAQVAANNRAQAARIVSRDGHTVRNVNMVG